MNYKCIIQILITIFYVLFVADRTSFAFESEVRHLVADPPSCWEDWADDLTVKSLLIYFQMVYKMCSILSFLHFSLDFNKKYYYIKKSQIIPNNNLIISQFLSIILPKQLKSLKIQHIRLINNESTVIVQ